LGAGQTPSQISAAIRGAARAIPKDAGDFEWQRYDGDDFLGAGFLDMRAFIPEPESQFYAHLYADGKLEFEGSGGMRDFSGNRYTTDAPWQPYRNEITEVVIPEGVTSIGDYAFFGIQYYSKDYRFGNLTKIDIPESVEDTGRYAFSGCVALSNVDIPDRLTTINDGVFSGCASLTTLTMLDGIYNIGNEAFSGCAGLSLLLIPESVNSIGKNAFAKCRALTLQVHEDSYALEYAKERQLRYEIIESGEIVPGVDPVVDDPTVMPVTPISPAAPFDVTRDAYPFVNNAESFGYTGALTGKNYPIPYSSFQLIFGDSIAGKSKYKQTTMGQWGGNCNGLSSTTALMYAGITLTPSSFNKENAYSISIDDASSEIAVKTFIEAMQISQYTDSFAKDYQGNKRTTKQLRESGLSLNNLIETVEADVAKGKCDIIAVGKQGVGAHALLAYRMEKVSDTEYTMYLYDCNFPGEIRTAKLTADSSGLFTHWTYNMGSYGDWGTEGADGPRCFISFIPFDTVRFIWENRGSMYQSKEMLSVNVANLSIEDATGKEVARLEDGNLITDSTEIFEVPELSMHWSDNNSIYLPKDLYTIRTTDSQELQASMTDRNLEAAVTTSSNNVTFAVDDASRENTVFIDNMTETDTYAVELSSSFMDAEYETLSISGTGSEGMTGDTISISGAKDSLALSSNITYNTLKINETEQQKQYTIKAEASEGGSISPSGDVKVLPGASQSFTFVPKVGYKFDYIEVDGVKLENLTISGTYTFTLAEEDTDRAITAYFSKAYEIGEAAFDPASRTVNVTNLLSLTDAVLTAMAFDGNGKFVACATKNVSADAETASVTFATELPENCSVKLVLTDKDMKPLCSPFPVQSA
ncbi:MAG: leucine-rich repeat domain-containing protein, partial [Oscillibacter sp.]|nr:leucine-rich repeat domain-containing protein [Oscillibacter sp.]